MDVRSGNWIMERHEGCNFHANSSGLGTALNWLQPRQRQKAWCIHHSATALVVIVNACNGLVGTIQHVHAEQTTFYENPNEWNLLANLMLVHHKFATSFRVRRGSFRGDIVVGCVRLPFLLIFSIFRFVSYYTFGWLRWAFRTFINIKSSKWKITTICGLKFIFLMSSTNHNYSSLT